MQFICKPKQGYRVTVVLLRLAATSLMLTQETI